MYSTVDSDQTFEFQIRGKQMMKPEDKREKVYKISVAKSKPTNKGSNKRIESRSPLFCCISINKYIF